MVLWYRSSGMQVVLWYASGPLVFKRSSGMHTGERSAEPAESRLNVTKINRNMSECQRASAYIRSVRAI